MNSRILAVLFLAVALLGGVVRSDVICSVSNAFNNDKVEGALCSLRSGSETSLYGSTTTDADGLGTIAYNLMESTDYLLRVTHPDFYTTDSPFTFNLTAGSDYTVHVPVSPILNTTAIRAVLRWGQDPSDLDTHVYANAPGFETLGSMCHMYYSNKQCRGAGVPQPAITLDVDDVNGYGPETTTFENLPVGFYSYWVYIYSGGSFSDSIPLPTVDVFTGSTGNGVFKTFTAPVVPGNTDEWWHVFNVVVSPSSSGCTSVTIESVNEIHPSENSTSHGTVSSTTNLGELCGSTSSVCNNRVTGTWATCGNFGDPHIITWDRQFITCRAEGNALLVDNEWFSLGMNNIVVEPESGATATNSIRLIYKKCNPMTIFVTPTSFPDPVNAPDAGVHIIRREGNNLYLDAINTRIQIRESGGYLVFGISTPFWDHPGICKGCPNDMLNTSSPLVPRKRAINAYSVEQANETCTAAGLEDFFLEACIFDLVTTGDTTFVAQAQSAVTTYAEVQTPFMPAPVAPPPVTSGGVSEPPVLAPEYTAGASSLASCLLLTAALFVALKLFL